LDLVGVKPATEFVAPTYPSHHITAIAQQHRRLWRWRYPGWRGFPSFALLPESGWPRCCAKRPAVLQCRPAGQGCCLRCGLLKCACSCITSVLWGVQTSDRGLYQGPGSGEHLLTGPMQRTAVFRADGGGGLMARASEQPR